LGAGVDNVVEKGGEKILEKGELTIVFVLWMYLLILPFFRFLSNHNKQLIGMSGVNTEKAFECDFIA